MARPSGLARDDLLVLTLSWSYNGPLPTIPSGFVEQARDIAQGTDATSPYIIVAFRWIGDPTAEPASYAVGGSTSAEHSAELVAWRGVDKASPLALPVVFALTANSTSQTIPTRELPEDATWVGFWALQRYTAASDNSFTLPAAVSLAEQHTLTFNFSATGYESRTAGTVPARTATAKASASAGRVASFALRGATTKITPDSATATTTHPAPTLVPEPTLIQTYPAETNALGVIQTAQFTPLPGELLVVKGYVGHSLAAMSAPSGGGLSFANRALSNLASYTPLRIDTAVVPAAGVGAMAVSATVSNTSNTNAYSPSLVVERWANAKLLDTVATNSVKTGTTSQTMNPVLTTAAEGSVVTYAVGDWVPVTTGTATFRSPGVSNYARRSTAVNYWSAWQRTTAVGGQVLGMTAPTGQKWTLLGIELARGAASTPASQTVTPEAATSTTTHPAPTLTAGAKAVTPESSTSSTTHSAPSLAAGAVTVRPDAGTSSTTHPAPALRAGTIELRPDAASSAASYSDPAVGRGPVELRPDGRTGSTTHSAPTLAAGAVELRPDSRTAAAQHAAPALWVGPVELRPDGRTAATAHGTPAVGRGAAELRPDACTASSTHFASAVGRGAVALRPDARTAAAAHAAPAVGRGPVDLAVYGRDELSVSYPTPAVERGPVELRPAAATASAQHFAPAVTSTITPELATARAQHADPILERGSVDLSPELSTARTTHGTPGVGALPAEIVAEPHAAGVEHFAPDVEPGPVDLDVELDELRTEHGEPVIEPGPIEIDVELTAADAEHFAPQVERGPAAIVVDVEHDVAVTHRTVIVRRGPVGLVPELATAGTWHGAPAVGRGPVVVRVPVQRPSTTHGVPAVWVGSIELRPELATAAASSTAPSVGRGPRRIAPEPTVIGVEHPAPLIVRGAYVPVVPGRLGISAAPGGLTVSDAPSPSRLEVTEAW